MTYSMKIGKYKLVFSDSNFKPLRKKPTISVYDEEENCETKVASFNNQEVFEWFVGLLSSELETRKEPDNVLTREQIEKITEEYCQNNCQYSEKQRHIMCGSCGAGCLYEMIMGV